MNNPHALLTQKKWIQLSRKELKHIFIYYSIIFMLSLIGFGVLLAFFIDVKDDSIGMILLLSFVCGLLGSTFYYIRKLYKSCIQLLVDTENNVDSIMALGTKVYFYFRPIMGATLAAFIVLGIYCGFFFLQDHPTINTEKFYYFTALIAFIVGFSNGNIIDQMDRNKDKITQFLKLGKEEK